MQLRALRDRLPREAAQAPREGTAAFSSVSVIGRPLARLVTAKAAAWNTSSQVTARWRTRHWASGKVAPRGNHAPALRSTAETSSVRSVMRVGIGSVIVLAQMSMTHLAITRIDHRTRAIR